MLFRSNHHATDCAGLAPLDLLVIGANIIVHALDLSEDPDDLVPPVPTGFWQQLGLNDTQLLAVFDRTENQFESASLVITT